MSCMTATTSGRGRTRDPQVAHRWLSTTGYISLFDVVSLNGYIVPGPWWHEAEGRGHRVGDDHALAG